MKRVSWNSRRIFLATVALLAVACLLPAGWLAFITALPARALEFTVVPVAHIGRWVSGNVRPPQRPATNSRDLDSANRDRDIALTYSRQLEEDLIRARQALRDIGVTRDILGPTRRTPLFASVAASNDSRTNPTLTLNRGTHANLRKGLFVTSGMSLVGQVTDANYWTTTVQLITKPETYIGVRITPPEPGRATRETIARAEASPNGREFFAEIAKDDPVQINDLAHIAQSDTRYGEVRGFVIGRVTRKAESPRQPHLLQRVTIEPLVRLTDLDHVYVLLPPEATDDTPPPVRGGGR